MARRGGIRGAAILAAVSTLLLGQAATAAETPTAVVAAPPMGWASWNSYAAAINAAAIKTQVDAIVSSGLKDAGYQYVDIDEGWWQGTRDSSGNITVDQNDWPGGMKSIVDYIHGKGLKAGIYTDAGRDGCGYYFPTGRPAAPGTGSEGHYDQDFLQFSQWGFDIVKVDWCGGDHERLDARSTYQAISDSIGRATARTGRPMVLSVCDWGRQSPWNWAPGMSTMWRDTDDLIIWGQAPSMDHVLANFDGSMHPEAQGPGHYNDPDMLVVGLPGFTPAQNRTHLSLWAVSGAPLVAGNDIATMNADTRAVLTNREVIAIDQDPLSRQGVKVAEDQAGRQVYSKVLAGNGRRAVVALNRTDTAGPVTIRFADLGLADTAAVRDVWGATDRGSMTTSYTVTVPAHEAVLLTVAGTDEPGTGTRVGRIVGKQSNRCLDIDNSSTTNGTQAQLWDCNGQDNQRWTYTAGKQLTIYGGTKCLDAMNAGTTPGTPVVIWDCNGQGNQQWNVNSDGTIRGVQSGLCVDANQAGTANGTKIILWSCGTGDNQLWSLL
ncbi:ricin-type beta-trefoil lectin domain protein [Kutzneria buriramensis]|uniref:Alpha-galactosidase n=1 Tax=Kutzneria buriramensis TaxID=1045776 RepID=A0A3E0GX29_9PSEU|nr:ricin-type beta-trefoil lectin domain protein [Kutzneria buriramensis]REH29662.1 ricin-type beta-trefoil lectin protein [Kutzneria buriramensis]